MFCNEWWFVLGTNQMVVFRQPVYLFFSLFFDERKNEIFVILVTNSVTVRNTLPLRVCDKNVFEQAMDSWSIAG